MRDSRMIPYPFPFSPKWPREGLCPITKTSAFVLYAARFNSSGTLPLSMMTSAFVPASC